MSATKTVIVLAALTAALFTSCKKSEYVTPDNRNVQSAKAGEGGNVNLQFKTGTIGIRGLTIQMDQRILAEVGPGSLSLQDPIMKMAPSLPLGYYDNLTTVLKLVPENGASLQLTGLMSMDMIADDGTVIPGQSRSVNFSINTPMDVAAKSGRITIEEFTSLQDVLSLNLDKLGTDIPDDIWMRAFNETKEGEAIRISEQSNPELYQMILRNLGTMLQPYVVTQNPAPIPPAHIVVVDRPTHVQ